MNSPLALNYILGARTTLRKVVLSASIPGMDTPTAVPAVEKIARARKRGMKSVIGDRRLRRIAHGTKEFYHRAKNGVYDPMTYFHITWALYAIGGEPFRTRDFVEALRGSRPQLAWDTTTVGRVLNDIAETLEEANGRPYISTARRWNGMIYAVQQTPEAKAVLIRLLDDLMDLSEKLVELEKAGQAPRRMDSPLLQCSSVHRV